MDIDHTADEDLWGLSADGAWEAIENCAILAKKMDNPTSVVTDQLIASLRDQVRSLFGDNRPIDEIPRYNENIGNLDTMVDEVINPSPPSTPTSPTII